MREKFMFFQNFKETADKLPDDLRLKYYDAIMDYVFNGKEPDDPIMAALINSIKPSLDKVDERGGAREGAGRKSNEIKNNQKQSNEIKASQNNQSFQETETEIRNRSIEKEKLKEKVAVATRFTKPTLNEIKTYNQETGLGIDEQAFMDFYESKGWKVGNSPMKDWKAAVRNWARHDRQPAKQPDEPMVEIEQGKFYIDDTIPAYADVCRRMTPETQERAWKWIMGKFEGQTIKQSIVVDLLNKMAAADERMVANG